MSDLPKIENVIRMTTSKGRWFWTGSGTQQDMAGPFRTLGWSERLERAQRYQTRRMAERTAQRLHGDHARLFDVVATDVLEVEAQSGMLGVTVRLCGAAAPDEHGENMRQVEQAMGLMGALMEAFDRHFGEALDPK